MIAITIIITITTTIIIDIIIIIITIIIITIIIITIIIITIIANRIVTVIIIEIVVIIYYSFTIILSFYDVIFLHVLGHCLCYPVFHYIAKHTVSIAEKIPSKPRKPKCLVFPEFLGYLECLESRVGRAGLEEDNTMYRHGRN